MRSPLFVIEISDFDQQYFSEEEAESAASGLSVIESDEDDDFLELIDVEDDEDEGVEGDDEIIHFGQPDSENDAMGVNGLEPESDSEEIGLEPTIEDETVASMETPLLFSEDVPDETSEIESESEPDNFSSGAPIPGFLGSSLAEENIDSGTEIDDTADDEDSGDTVIPAAVSTAQIEAAVASIIERDYAGRIESMVATAIEKVVSLEIERIKSNLFGDDDS